MNPIHIISGIFIAGIIGTLTMTLGMYLFCSVTGKFTKVIHILGNMLVGESNYYSPSINAFIVGSIGHFGIGILFSCSYYFMWNVGYLHLTFISSAVVGFLSGCLAIAAWKVYLTLHSTPPKFSQRHYFLALLLSHIILGFVTIEMLKLIF